MKYVILCAALFLMSCKNTSPDTAATEAVEQNVDSDVTTLYLIRHAEKQEGKDPELTEEGKNRAAAWVNYFMLKNVDHVISSDYKRTKSTAAPLARDKQLEVEIYDVRNMDGKKLLEKYKGTTVVLMGHSNTVPKYTNDLLNEKKYSQLDESIYDTFYVVRVDASGNVQAQEEKMDFMKE